MEDACRGDFQHLYLSFNLFPGPWKSTVPWRWISSPSLSQAQGRPHGPLGYICGRQTDSSITGRTDDRFAPSPLCCRREKLADPFFPPSPRPLSPRPHPALFPPPPSAFPLSPFVCHRFRVSFHPRLILVLVSFLFSIFFLYSILVFFSTMSLNLLSLPIHESCPFLFPLRLFFFLPLPILVLVYFSHLFSCFFCFPKVAQFTIPPSHIVYVVFIFFQSLPLLSFLLLSLLFLFVLIFLRLFFLRPS